MTIIYLHFIFIFNEGSVIYPLTIVLGRRQFDLINNILCVIVLSSGNDNSSRGTRMVKPGQRGSILLLRVMLLWKLMMTAGNNLQRKKDVKN